MQDTSCFHMKELPDKPFLSYEGLKVNKGILKMLKNDIHTAIGHAILELSRFNPIRPGLFSLPGPGGRGGSEARMPKIKGNINQL